MPKNNPTDTYILKIPKKQDKAPEFMLPQNLNFSGPHANLLLPFRHFTPQILYTSTQFLKLSTPITCKISTKHPLNTTTF